MTFSQLSSKSVIKPTLKDIEEKSSFGLKAILSLRAHDQIAAHKKLRLDPTFGDSTVQAS